MPRKLVTVEIVQSSTEPPRRSTASLPNSSESVFKGARTRLYNRLRRLHKDALIVSVWTDEELAELGGKTW